jgi:anti-sigma B factor antagonist
MFDFQKHIENGVTVLKLKGHLDALTAGKIKPLLDDMLLKRNVYVVYDLQELSLIDSSGIGVVVSTFKRTRALGGNTIIAGIDNQPKQVFNVLCLHKYMEICDSVEEAIDRLSKKRS